MGAPRRRLTLLGLCATTFFVVSGGPYGLEEVVLYHGYARTLLLLLLVPLIWSLPVALLVGELGGALPETGGYYAWVRRGLGPFWGLQEAWLSIAYSLFDMAIYPTLFVTYLGRVWPALLDTTLGGPGWWVGAAMIATCVGWNVLGTRAVGGGGVVLAGALLAPFAVLVGLGGWRIAHDGAAWAMLRAPSPSGEDSGWFAGIVVCMWNTMGWDNVSTIASEVRAPQRTYPRAMLLTLGAVVVCYALPVLAAASTGLPPSAWTAGSWVEIGARLGGGALGWTIVVCGAVSAFGMFNALVLSTSRLPVAMAEDGWLPRALATRHPRTDAPTRAIVVAALLYAACLGLGLRRLIELDVTLYGAALLLEFVALVALRRREPTLPRPFAVPGGTLGAALLGVPPAALLLVALWMGRHEDGVLGAPALLVSAVIAAGGPLWWWLGRARRAAA